MYNSHLSLIAFISFMLFILCSCGPSKENATSVDKELKSIEEVPGSPDIVKVQTPSSPTSLIDPESMDQKLLTTLIQEAINKERIANGKKILVTDDHLTAAAQNQNEIQSLMGVLNPNEEASEQETILKRVNYYGGDYTIVGENVQYYAFLVQMLEGKITLLPPDYNKAATDIVENWLKSPQHKENLLDEQYSNFGTSVAWNGETKALFVTQVYGGYSGR